MERSYFYDDVYYSAADHRRFYAQIIGNGVSDENSLTVSEKQNMTVMLGAGWAFSNGAAYENTATKDLIHDTAEPNTDRIDRIIIAFDDNPEQRSSYSYIKKGTPASNPVPPSLIRDDYITEYSVAQVFIEAGKSFIEQSQITDERANSAVCGYIPLHNIYRGMQINELGMTSFPNQSFVSARNDSPIQLTNSSQVVPFFADVETDKQGEVMNSNTFRAKADGIYYFWIEIGWVSGGSDPGLVDVDVQVYFTKNGTQEFPLAARVLVHEGDNFLIQSGVDELQEGDEVQLRAQAYRAGDLPATDFVRIRIAKVS